MGLEGAFEGVLHAAQANAGWAFTRLYESLAPAVTAYVRTQGVDDADDVVSEVFLAAFSRLGSFVGHEAQFRSWVFTIAHHRIVDSRRISARRPRLESLDGVRHGLADVRSVEDDALSWVGLDHLRPVLERLTTDQREVLVLRVVADLSVEDVAEMMGRQPGAVRALQHRAVNALRRALVSEAVTR
jgi:RNA polymerase sigma factor (sigma-70 family)